MVARGILDIGVFREVSFWPHIFESYHNEHHDDHKHRYQHHHYPQVQRLPFRPRSRHPQGYRPRPYDQPHYSQREANPFLVIADVLLKVPCFDQEFRVLMSAEKRRPHFVVVAAIRRKSLCVHDTSQPALCFSTSSTRSETTPASYITFSPSKNIPPTA